MSELDKAARLTWIEMGEMQPIEPAHSILNFSRSKDFESVRNAVLFVMESMAGINRRTAMIHIDTKAIALPEIENLYNQIRKKTI